MTSPHDSLTTDAPPPSDASTSTILLLAAASFLATFLLFLPGQIVQLLNLPFGLLVTSLLVFGSAGLLLPASFGQPVRAFCGLSVGQRPWKTAAAIIGLGFLVGLANMGLANFGMGALREWLPRDWSTGADNVTRLLVAADHPARLMLVLAAGVAAPVGEELFFRGWLQGLLVRRLPGWLAVLLVALVFSFTHLDPVGFIPRVELGILFGLLRLWTGSLYPAVAAHAAHNLLSTAALYATDDPLAELEQPFEWGMAALVAAASLLATLALAWLTRRLSSTPSSVSLSAADSAPPAPLRPRPQRFLAGAALAGVLLAGATTTLWLVGERLPGARLVSRPSWIPHSPAARTAPVESAYPK